MKSMPIPRLSIIMPIYNGEAYLEETLGAILGQTFTDWELLVVDDGSSDRSTSIARQHRARHPDKIRCLEHPGHANHGQLASRVLGAAQSRADVIALIDQDDYWEPTYLEKHWERWQEVAAQGVHLSYGPGLYWYADDRAKDYVQPMPPGAPRVYAAGELLSSFLETDYRNTPCPSCAFLRREVFAGVKPFERFAQGSHCEDQYLWWYVAARWPVAVHLDPWARYRQHEKSAFVQFTASFARHARAELTFLSVMRDDLESLDPALVPSRLTEKVRELAAALPAENAPAPDPTAPTSAPALSLAARLKGWLRPSRWLRKSPAPPTIVLMYHRVADRSIDPCLLCVRPKHFAEQVEVLRRDYEILPLALAQNGHPARRPRVVVTFDDGYADNLLGAKPILERFGAPATVFVTAGFVGGEREFWWDELERALLQPGTLPSPLHLDIQGTMHEWDLADTAHYDADRQAREASWGVLAAIPGPRQQVYMELLGVMRGLPTPDQQSVLEQLRGHAGLAPLGRQINRTMAAQQVRQLAEGDLVEVGAHTMNHPMLAAQTRPIQQREIHESKRQLEELLDRPVNTFAYPFGDRTHYTDETVELVREAGFVSACSNFTGWVGAETDPYQLPRFMVFDWDGDTFARHLEQWCQAPV